MNSTRFPALSSILMMTLSTLLHAADDAPPKIAGVHEAIAPFIEKKEISGAVTLVVTPEKVIHLESQGLADVASGRPMQADTVFWIASMTKPITSVALLTLQDEGKLSVNDPVSTYLPEFANLKNKDGSPAKPITIKHLMTHSSGLPENTPEETHSAKNLQDLVTAFTKKPMQFEPGSKWQYCQTGINSMGRIIEVVSGKKFEDFLDERIIKPLGMIDTTFYPSADLQKRLATAYKTESGKLNPTDIFAFAGRDLADRNRVPLANGGLFSTAGDYAKFCRMLLNNGALDGKQYLKPETVKQMSSVQSGELKTGFTEGNGWGLGVCVVREPQGVTAALSPGSFGHGGAYGTQVWIDPVKKVGYVLMVQRANFPNSDASDVRKAFQDAAAAGMKK
jgi:CubicO group peptidase (beta-lactamase class C family)